MLCCLPEIRVDHAACGINGEVAENENNPCLDVLEVRGNRQKEAAVLLKKRWHLVNRVPAEKKIHQNQHHGK